LDSFSLVCSGQLSRSCGLHDDMSGAVFVRTLQLRHDLAGAITFEPFVGDSRPSDKRQSCSIPDADRRAAWRLKPCALTRSSGVEALAALHQVYERDVEQFAIITMNIGRELSRRLRQSGRGAARVPEQS